MDYEKMYKAALKTAAQWIKDGCTDKEKICLECVFPELRESEDERIRKLLVWQVYRNIEDETNDLAQSVYDGIKGHDPDLEESIEDWKKCLAYLEKQKEQKPAEVKDPFSNANFVRGYESGYADAKREQKPAQTSEEKEYIRTLKNLISAFVYDKQPQDVVYYQHVYDWLEERHIEQKPELCDFGRWDEESYNNGIHHVLQNPETYGLTKQKPAEWSDTNELVFKDICKHLKEEGYNGWIVLLEALRNGEFQPKQEWSEEDERAINCACVALRAYAHGDLPEFLPSELMGYADRLQSLRFDSYKNCNSRWKPSEEQMEAFRSYIKDFQAKAEAAVGGWNNFDVMIRLYEQLKKLM